MADNNCNPCKDSVFKTLSSNPDLADIVELILGGELQNVEVVGDDEFIFVDESQINDKTRFTVRYEPYVPLSITSFQDDIGLQLKGNTVSTFNLSWAYNKVVEVQSLNQGLTAPTATLTDKSYSLAVTGQSITTDTTITLTADDIVSDNRGSKSASHSILFGNYIYYGAVNLGNSQATYNPSEVNIKALSSTRLTRNKASGGSYTFSNFLSNEYEVIAIPTAYNTTNFKVSINLNAGGFELVKTLNITNSSGFTESYEVYRTTYDATAGTDASGNPITYTII